MREDKSRRTGNVGVAISTGSRSKCREGGREGGRGEERIARESRGGEGEAEDKQVLMR